MGLGQKIKEALHHDEPANKSYETNKPPGAFPSDSTTTGTTGTNTTGTNTSSRTGGYTGGATTGSGLTGNTHGGATGDIAGTGKTTHRPTDSGVDVAHRKNVTDEYNRTGERGTTTQDPYWGSLGRESHGVTGSNARTGYDDPSGTHGPHGNRAANAADPRVDSDRDHRGAPGTGLTGTHGTHGTTGTSGLGGTHGTTGTSGLTGSNARTGYDDPSGTHGPHGNRAGNLADPRVDSDRDHRGAPGTGLTGTHGTHGTTGTSGLGGTHGTTGTTGTSGLGGTHGTTGTTGTSGLGGTHGTTGTSGLAGSNVTTGYDDPSGVHGPHGNRAANLADPRVDSDRDHRGAPGGLTGANKDLPLRPNEQYGSSYERTSGNGPQAVGGGHYNPNVTAGGHHDPTSGVDRSIEGRDFTHTGGGHGGAGNQQYGISNPVSNPNLAGAHSNDPYDTRMRDRDMGRDRTGHGLAGGVAGAGLGVAASEAARRHHHDDIRDSGYGGNNTGLNTGGNFNSSTNTRGDLGGVGNSPTTRGNLSGTDDFSRTGLTGTEPGVPNSSMLDPYTKSQSGGVGLIGRNGSPPWNQGPTSGPNTSSTGPSHYGPAHEGAKVMHTCTHCGNDNDISQYFKKDAVYRMGR